MPVALFVCPHCEKHAEVQVTSVTRSRPCPHCGEIVVLQVSGKDKSKARRRALLVASGELPPLTAEPNKSAPGPAYEPMPLEGDALERMKLDPEVAAFRRRFIVGLAALAGIVLLISVWHFVGGDLVDQITLANNASKPTEAVSQKRPADPLALPPNAVGMRRGSVPVPVSSKLVFEPPSAAAERPGVSAPSSNFVETAPAKEAPPPSIEAQENSSDSARKVRLAMTDPRVQAAAALERFLVANNIDAMLATVANRQSVEPQIRRYLESNPLVPLDYQSLTISNGAGPTGERAIVITLKDGTQREANVVREDGRSVVDWPSFVAWSDMEWAHFMDKKPAEPILFRVIAEAEQRYDNAFADPKKLACLKLINPRDTTAHPLYAYVERSSIIGQEIDVLMRQAEGRPTKLTLHLKYPAKATSQDQVWIDSVLASGWMVPRSKSTAQNTAR